METTAGTVLPGTVHDVQQRCLEHRGRKSRGNLSESMDHFFNQKMEILRLSESMVWLIHVSHE
jgi:hypothetical protein